MLAALAGVVQERQGAADDDHRSAECNQCRSHSWPRKTKPPTAPRRKLIPVEMNAG
jgi:hypothetical protein